MSQFYKPNRKPDWNYGGSKWRLSRSKIALFLECPRCFYIDNKLGVARPPGFPFNLNSAVDALFKKEFDVHRAAGSAHPLMEQYGVDAVPYAHPDLNTLKCLAPRVQLGVGKRHGVDAILLYKWVCRRGHAVYVKLFFEQRIDRRIEVKGKARRPRDAELVIDIKTSLAL